MKVRRDEWETENSKIVCSLCQQLLSLTAEVLAKEVAKVGFTKIPACRQASLRTLRLTDLNFNNVTRRVYSET